MNSLFSTIRKNWNAPICVSGNNTISSGAYTFLVCIILFLFIVLLWGIAKIVIYDKDVRELWSDFGLYLAHPGRIFSAEYDVPPHERILQQPTKCFSCERDMIRRGIDPAYGNKTKCFSCENEIVSSCMF